MTFFPHIPPTAAQAPDDAADEMVEAIDEQGRWRGRDVTYLAGRWQQVAKQIPVFSLEPFRADVQAPENPYLRVVIRQPLRKTEGPIPVGVVSNSYSLAQHAEVIERCFDGLRKEGIDPETLRCEVGLTDLGEWMNFRAFFPESFTHTPQDGNPIQLRLECYNSVDGSSRLTILLGWFRLICSNGMVIGDTKASLREIHNENLDLSGIPRIVASGLAKVNADLKQLRQWQDTTIELSRVEAWADTYLAEKWGKKAACRALHICRAGVDVDFLDPFARGRPSEKPVRQLGPVPGSPRPARNLYDVSQALSWIATRRNNVEERVEWQVQIPVHIEQLKNTRRKPRGRIASDG